MWRALEGVYRLRRRQGWPAAGGWTDQTRVFLESLDLVDRLDPARPRELEG